MEEMRSSGHRHRSEEDDDEEGFPDDQVVYHDEEHLQKLFQLYTRPEEDDKHQCASQAHCDDTDLGRQRGHALPALPSVQEVAVWNALENAFECPNFENGNRKISDNTRSGQRNISDLLENELRTEDPLTNQSVELISDVKELWNLKDSWYSTEVNADPGDILPASVMRNKSHLKQQKGGTYKKKLSFSFGTINKKKLNSSADQKLSLAGQLLNLVKPNHSYDSSITLQNQSKNVTPSTTIAINQRLLQLVQCDSKFQLKEAGSSNHQKKSKSSHAVSNFVDDNVNQQNEREQSLIFPRETIHQKLQKALSEALPVTFEAINVQAKGQVSGFGFTGRLQKVVERERNDRAAFLKKMQMKDGTQGQENCMELKICEKTLEAHFAACLCEVLKSPQSCQADSHGAQISTKLMVIINLQTNAELEVEIGNIIRLYPPW